jgi:hypothetical protein
LQDKHESEFQKRSNGKFRTECKSCAKEYNKRYRSENKESISEQRTESYKANREKILGRAKKFYETNKEHIKERTNEYYQKNKEQVTIKRRSYQKQRLSEDPTFKSMRNLRNRLWYALHNKGWKKSSKFAEYIGLNDYTELTKWLESNFTQAMSWDNYGSYWDIDHIIPLSSAKDEEQLYKLCHYSNLIPKERIANRVEKRDVVDFNTEYEVRLIDYRTGQDFLLEHHYSKREAPSEYTFGLFLTNGTLVGVCTFATPYSPGLKRMICGEENKDNVIELNRLALVDWLPANSESWFVAQCLNSGAIKKNIVVTFADTAQGHLGTIYKALNFIYTGLTDRKWEYTDGSNTHAFTLAKKEDKSSMGYKLRSQKHRFVYFVGDRRTRKKLRQQLKLPIK